MTEIQIQTKNENDGWIFTVDLIDGESQTSHKVKMTKEDYQKLTNEKCSPEECVKKSFEFLLEQESKESILPEFNITKIGNYFPEYGIELRKRIEK